MVLAQLFVIAAHHFGVAVRNGITINWDKSVGVLAAGQFIGNLIAHLDQWLHHLQLNHRPIRLLEIALVFLSEKPRALSGGGDLVAQARIIDHFFDIAQTVGPPRKILAGDGPADIRSAVFIENSIQTTVEVAPTFAAVINSSAISRTTSSVRAATLS